VCGLGPRDVEGAVLDLNTVQLATPRTGSHEQQTLVQQTGTASDIAFGVGLAADTSSRHPSRLRR
jgi:hypothetical protein